MDLPSIKDYIIPGMSEGVFLSFDFSQLEIGWLAELSGDETLIAELNSGTDIHRRNAAAWKKIPEKDVTDEVRRAAKSMTFMLQYGAGAKKIAATLGIKEGDAKAFIEAYYMKYNRIERYHLGLMSLARSFDPSRETCLVLSKAATNTPFGVEYWLNPKVSEYTGKLSISPTGAKNYPVQGAATGDFVPFVVNCILAFIRKAKIPAWMVNTIHDDFTIEVQEEYAYHVMALVEYVFANLHSLMLKAFDYELQVQYNYYMKMGTTLGNMYKLSRAEVKQLLAEAS